MMKKYILIITIFIIFIFSTAILKYNDSDIVEVKQVFSNEVLGNTVLKENSEEKELYLIKIYYPQTEYENLNQYITDKINKEKKSFLEEVNKIGQLANGRKYEFGITFTQYQDNSYVSFVFDVMVDLCGAHPNNYIFTVNYDTSSKKIITLEDMVKTDSKLLNKLSTKTYELLKDDESIKKYSDEEILKDGLKPIVSNFENFIFNKDKIIIFINTYQVAPYVAGNFEVTIPYSEIFENGT